MTFFTRFSFRLMLPVVVLCTVLSSASLAVEMSSSQSLLLEQMNHEVKRLRQDLAIMQKEFYKEQTNRSFVQTNRPRGDVSSQIEVQLSEMQEQLQQMNGRIEEAQHHISKMQGTLDKALDDVATRLNALEQSKLAGSTSQSMVRNFGEDKNAPVDLNANPSSPSDEKKATDEVNDNSNADEAAFKEAKKLLEQAQYEAAAIKFQAFISTYKNSTFLPEAYYWQGELFSIRQQDENAAVSFLKAYQTNPKSEKAGDSLLRLGGVLGNLGKVKEACTTFDKAEKEFPKLSDLKKQLGEERQRLGC